VSRAGSLHADFSHGRTPRQRHVVSAGFLAAVAPVDSAISFGVTKNLQPLRGCFHPHPFTTRCGSPCPCSCISRNRSGLQRWEGGGGGWGGEGGGGGCGGRGERVGGGGGGGCGEWKEGVGGVKFWFHWVLSFLSMRGEESWEIVYDVLFLSSPAPGPSVFFPLRTILALSFSPRRGLR